MARFLVLTGFELFSGEKKCKTNEVGVVESRLLCCII